MKYITHFIFTIAIAFSTISLAHTKDDSVKVLFIGNSLTGANYLPTVLQAIANANHKQVIIGAEIKNGTSLYQHWQAGEVQAKISNQHWDYVILQDASAFEHPEKTLEFGGKFAQFIKENGAKPLLFNTWAYQGVPTWINEIKVEQERAGLTQFIPTMYQNTNGLYQQLSKRSHSDVVPVAQTWNALFSIDPSVKLHAQDKTHPSPMGTYLTAVVFYRAIFDELPKVLPEQLQTQRDQKI